MFFGISLDLWVVCVIVILGRIVDMSLETIRIVFSVKERPLVASSLGFVETFFWFIIVKAALDYVVVSPVIDTFALAISYSLGFAIGTFLGGILSKFLVKGTSEVQIVLTKDYEKFAKLLKDNNFSATIVPAQGVTKNKKTYFIHVETKSKNVNKLKNIIQKYDPNAFVSINEVKEVHNGYFGNTK